MKIKATPFGGTDKQVAKLVIDFMDDNWSPESTEESAPLRTIELAFAGFGIFKVLGSGQRQILTGHQDNLPDSLEKILANCDLAEQYEEVKMHMLKFLTVHFGPIKPGLSGGLSTQL